MYTLLEEEKKKIKPKSLTSLSKLNLKGGPKDLSGRLDKYLYRKNGFQLASLKADI